MTSDSLILVPLLPRHLTPCETLLPEFARKADLPVDLVERQHNFSLEIILHLKQNNRQGPPESAIERVNQGENLSSSTK